MVLPSSPFQTIPTWPSLLIININQLSTRHRPKSKPITRIKTRTRTASMSSPRHPAPSSTVSSSSAMPTPVCHLVYLPFDCANITSYSVRAILYPSQRRREWILRHRMALRLAYPASPKRQPRSYATRRWSKGRMAWEASCCYKTDEETMGRWLG
jgi:hypothetical protein